MNAARVLEAVAEKPIVSAAAERALPAPVPAFRVQDMTVAYNRRPVLWDVDVDFAEGRLVGVMGPNGAGKSTLLKASLGLIPRASGRVEVFGDAFERRREAIAYVPQRESVDWDFPVSALDVVAMGLYRRIGWFWPVARRHRETAMRALGQVGMQDYAKRQISQLSGGQQQRVFLARALAQDAAVYLMDEPFAGVDAATEAAIVEVLRTLKKQGKTVVVVHHDLQTAGQYFDDVLLLNMRVVAFGAARETLTQENLRRTYGGRLTLLAEAAHAATARP